MSCSSPRMRDRGFTLIELLVSIILMIILLSAATLVFVRTTETVAVNQARQQVYGAARYALDTLESDLLGAHRAADGRQRFILENGLTSAGAAGPIAPGPGVHVCTVATGGAADLIVFRATAMAGGRLQPLEIAWHLIRADRALPGSGGGALASLPADADLLPGDVARGQTATPPVRPLYTLVRRTRAPSAADPAVYDAAPAGAAGQPVPDAELCSFVLSFNIEYLAADMSLSQLDPSPCPPADPLGDADAAGGTNDTPPTAVRVAFLRVTLVIVEGEGARQEREIQKTIWIPMG